MTPIELMERLKVAGIHFTMTTVRDFALMFQVTVPGERWEIEVFADGQVEIERFRSIEGADLAGEAALNELFEKYAN